MLVGYARVSTEDQSLELQYDALCAANCERIFEDKMSGARAKRPGLMAAIDFMSPGDTLVIWKLSRFSRSLKQLLDTLQLLGDNGIHLHCLTEKYDTTTAAGQLYFHMNAAFAQFERANMIENTLAGLAAARARGRVGGRRVVMDAAKQAQARALLLASPDLPVSRICISLDISPSTYYRYKRSLLPQVTPEEASPGGGATETDGQDAQQNCASY
jgi:DNA invertase Pin-like site-specific DNA recombinase